MPLYKNPSSLISFNQLNSMATTFPTQIQSDLFFTNSSLASLKFNTQFSVPVALTNNGFNLLSNPVLLLPSPGTTNNSRLGDQYFVQGFQFSYSVYLTAVPSAIPILARVICGFYRKLDLVSFLYTNSTTNVISTALNIMTGVSDSEKVFVSIPPTNNLTIVSDDRFFLNSTTQPVY